MKGGHPVEPDTDKQNHTIKFQQSANWSVNVGRILRINELGRPRPECGE
jgi:hypothetical protein